MIVSVDDFRKFVKTDIDDSVLEVKLRALESYIRKYTNNNFQNQNKRFYSEIKDGKLVIPSVSWLKVGDTVQVSKSELNNGVYVVKSMDYWTATLDTELADEGYALVTKVEYPDDVKMGVIEIMRWKLKNEDGNYNPDAEKEIQNESISRHSVTYAKDSTEGDIDTGFGVPKKYAAFLKAYTRARF